MFKNPKTAFFQLLAIKVFPSRTFKCIVLRSVIKPNMPSGTRSMGKKIIAFIRDKSKTNKMSLLQKTLFGSSNLLTLEV